MSNYSEHDQYLASFQTGYWATEDEASCPCHGSGWALSEVDTWHECPVHFQGQTHPEAEEGLPSQEEVEASYHSYHNDPEPSWCLGDDDCPF